MEPFLTKDQRNRLSQLDPMLMDKNTFIREYKYIYSVLPASIAHETAAIKWENAQNGIKQSIFSAHEYNSKQRAKEQDLKKDLNMTVVKSETFLKDTETDTVMEESKEQSFSFKTNYIPHFPSEQEISYSKPSQPSMDIE
jgi:hypothetical protein